MTSSRKTSHSGERPISACSPIASKLSPARPPPERTTSAGPVDALRRGAASISSGPRLRVVSPTVSRSEQRAAARAVRRRLRALEAALRAVDVTHWPPPRIEPEIVRVDVLAAPRALRTLGPDDVDLGVHHPPVERDVVLLLSRGGGSRPRARRRPGVARSGSGSRSASAGSVARAVVERPLERRRRLRLEAARGDLCLEPRCPLGPENVDPAVEDAAAARDRRPRPPRVCASSADSSSSESDCRSGSVSTGAFPVGRAL